MAVEACPECNSAQIYERSQKRPKFRCTECGSEFEQPNYREPLEIGFTREEKIEAVRRAASDCSEPLSRDQYGEWASDAGDRPSAAAVSSHPDGEFETWAEACAAAGVTAPPGNGRLEKWSEDEMVSALQDAHSRVPGDLSITDYERELRKQTGADVPSAQRIREKIGWNEAKRRAGLNEIESKNPEYSDK